jgi:hypothetical protein
VNQALRAQRDWPVADFAASVADRRDPGRLAPAFDSGDGIHLSDAGARALAETAAPLLLLSPPVSSCRLTERFGLSADVRGSGPLVPLD